MAPGSSPVGASSTCSRSARPERSFRQRARPSSNHRTASLMPAIARPRQSQDTRTISVSRGERTSQARIGRPRPRDRPWEPGVGGRVGSPGVRLGPPAHRRRPGRSRAFRRLGPRCRRGHLWSRLKHHDRKDAELSVQLSRGRSAGNAATTDCYICDFRRGQISRMAVFCLRSGVKAGRNDQRGGPTLHQHRGAEPQDTPLPSSRDGSISRTIDRSRERHWLLEPSSLAPRLPSPLGA